MLKYNMKPDQSNMVRPIVAGKGARNERLKERLEPFTFFKDKLLKNAKQRAELELAPN